jgi:TRAF-type zinc finger
VKCSGYEDGCTAAIKKCDLLSHEAACPLVPVNCEYCRKRIRKSALRAHYMSCEEAELECEMCHGVFKKKNYPIHVSALCEEGVMSCGRCSGTYKRKYKEYHDCVRHLQNVQKTMNEDIASLKEKVAEKDKRYYEFESRVMSELAEMKRMFETMKTSDSTALS